LWINSMMLTWLILKIWNQSYRHCMKRWFNLTMFRLIHKRYLLFGVATPRTPCLFLFALYYSMNVYLLKLCIVAQFDALLVSLEESSPNRFEDTNNILETSRKTLSRYHGKIFYSLNYLGPIITAEVL
jgi:hypothetical protein